TGDRGGRVLSRFVHVRSRLVSRRVSDLSLTALSSFSERPGRADARRNAERILDATAELLAGNPAVSLEQVAARAGVSRATLYHHFAGRDSLLDALTARSIAEVTVAVQCAAPEA